MILGAALFPVFGIKGILFPLIIQAINLIASIIGVSVVHSREDEDPMHALNRGYYVTSFVALLGFAAAVYFMLQGRWWLLGCGIVGILTSFLFVRITEYYTETRYRPVRSIAEASLTGPATNIISGLAVGMETPAMPVIVISLALLLSYYFGVRGLATHQESPTMPEGHLRHRHRHHGHALRLGLHPGHGHLRAHHRQRRRHHRDVQPARCRPREDGQAGRRRQHHQGAHQGLCHRLCRARRLSAFLRISRERSRHRRAPFRRCRRGPAGELAVLARESGQRPGLRRRAAGRHAHLSLLLDGHQGGGPHGAVRHQGRARAVQGESRHHGGNLQARLRPLRPHRHRCRAEGDGAARRACGRDAAGRRPDLPPPQRQLQRPRHQRRYADVARPSRST